MKLKLALCAVAFVAAPAAAQTTNCTRVGNTTTCTTDNSTNQGQARVDNARQALVDSTRPASPPNASTAVDAAEAAKNRRAAAYNQVGALIADGRCADARRLAAFYGQDDIIRDTAKACATPPSP